MTGSTLVLDEVPRIGITLAAGSVIDMIEGPTPDDSLVRVVCGKRSLLMYEVDLRERAEEISLDETFPISTSSG